MKSLVLFILTAYQKFFSPLMYQLLGQKRLCRYELTCSAYAKEAIEKFGVVEGSKKGFMRLLSCQPFFTVKGYEYI